MRNATSMESSGKSPAGSLADLQDARRTCIDLGRQGETVAELVVPLLRQATQELSRLEAQREELRKPGVREAQQHLLPKLNERIEELGQNVKRLERASRGLKELLSGLGGLGEQVQNGLARRDEELHEMEAIAREEKRMWLHELKSLREQVEGQERPGSASPLQQEDQQRLRSENESLPKLRAERDRLAQRVAELEKNLTAREQTLTAKEQTIEDLRRMIVLLTGDATSPASSKQPTPQPPPARPLLDPVSVVPLTSTRPVTPAKPKTVEPMFGGGTVPPPTPSPLEMLGTQAPVSPPPVAGKHERPMHRAPSMEIMLGPLDELEPAPPSLPPPVPALPPVPTVPSVTPVNGMPRASTRHAGPAKTPAPIPTSAPPVVARPGTLIISEDMFNEMIVEENGPGGSGRK